MGSFGRSSKSSIGCPLGKLREGELLREKSALWYPPFPPPLSTYDRHPNPESYYKARAYLEGKSPSPCQSSLCPCAKRNFFFPERTIAWPPARPPNGAENQLAGYSIRVPPTPTRLLRVFKISVRNNELEREGFFADKYFS